MSARSSILSDPMPYLPPSEPQKLQSVKTSDWARLGKTRKYKEVNEYMEQRKTFFQHFLPGGESLVKLAIEDPAKAGQWAALASVIVDEIEAIQYKIQLEVGK